VSPFGVFPLFLAAGVSLWAQQQAGPAGVIGPAQPNILPPNILPAGVGDYSPSRVAPSRAPVASDCAVDGTVTNAITGEAIPRARVALMGSGGQNGTSTDSSGRWNFSNVSCGAIQIMATRPGFLQGNAGQPRPGAFTRPVVLTSGSATHDVKVQLTPQSVVSGRVVDEQGDPVINVQVMALVSRIAQGRRTFQNTGSMNTNDLGEYRISGLPAGRFIICAHSQNFGIIDMANDDSTVGEACYPGPVEGGLASAMELAAGRETRVDLTLPRIPAVRIRGNINGTPKGRGVSVSLMKRGAPAGAMPMRPALVNPEGAFEIRGVTPGSYLLISDYFEAGKRLTARVPLEVGGANIDGLTVQLEPAFSVTGNIRFESQSGNAPPQVSLNLRSSDPRTGGGQTQISKDRTSFSINELMPGSYRLDAGAGGGFYLKSATLGGRDISREEIPITQAAGPIEVVMSDESGTVEGQVEDSNGQAIASWVMILQDGRAPRNFMSGADGHFKASGLAPGPYTVYAWDDVQQVEYADPEWMRRHASGSSVTVGPNQTAQARVRQQVAPSI